MQKTIKSIIEIPHDNFTAFEMGIIWNEITSIIKWIHQMDIFTHNITQTIYTMKIEII